MEPKQSLALSVMDRGFPFTISLMVERGNELVHANTAGGYPLFLNAITEAVNCARGSDVGAAHVLLLTAPWFDKSGDGYETQVTRAETAAYIRTAVTLIMDALEIKSTENLSASVKIIGTEKDQLYKIVVSTIKKQKVV